MHPLIIIQVEPLYSLYNDFRIMSLMTAWEHLKNWYTIPIKIKKVPGLVNKQHIKKLWNLKDLNWTLYTVLGTWKTKKK